MKLLITILFASVLLLGCIKDPSAKLKLSNVSVEKAQNSLEWISVVGNSMFAKKMEENTYMHTYSCENVGNKIATEVVVTCFVILVDGSVKVHKQKVRNIAPSEVLFIDIPIKTRKDSFADIDVVIDWK